MPTGIVFARNGGIIVAAPPQFIYLEGHRWR